MKLKMSVETSSVRHHRPRVWCKPSKSLLLCTPVPHISCVWCSTPQDPAGLLLRSPWVLPYPCGLCPHVHSRHQKERGGKGEHKFLKKSQGSLLLPSHWSEASHMVGQELVLLPHPAARDIGKCDLSSGQPCSQTLKSEALLLVRKHGLMLREELFVSGHSKTRSLDIIFCRNSTHWSVLSNVMAWFDFHAKGITASV